MVRFPIERSLFKITDAFHPDQSSLSDQWAHYDELISFQGIMHERFYSVISKDIATESFAVIDMTTVTRTV